MTGWDAGAVQISCRAAVEVLVSGRGGLDGVNAGSTGGVAVDLWERGCGGGGVCAAAAGLEQAPDFGGDGWGGAVTIPP